MVILDMHNKTFIIHVVIKKLEKMAMNFIKKA